MGTLLNFPAVSPAGYNPHLQALAEAVSGLVCELNSFQKLAEGSLSEALNRLETALVEIDEVGRRLPPGEFKARLDLDLAAIVAQLDQAKNKVADLGTPGSRGYFARLREKPALS
jgi:hypothetical protein